jgi:UDPglucose 6-dehydrogenase
MKVAIVGTGYVGLVTGSCLANWGHHVTCIDQDSEKITKLKNGIAPFFEPKLDELINKLNETSFLHYTDDLARGIKGAEIIFIAVGTPSRQGDGAADLSYVFNAAKQIASELDNDACIVVKSTVPIGTCDAVERIINLYRDSNTFSVASNPEFLRQGSAINDFEYPDRIVIGVNDSRAEEKLRCLYSRLIEKRVPLIVTDRKSSELVKYAANSFLALKIGFINEIADYCESVNASVEDVALGMGLDARIGTEFLEPGPGFGGSCFPKDTLALLRSAQEMGVPLRILEEVINSNNARKRRMVQKVLDVCGGSVSNKIVALFGVSFKPNTDDVRESPALPIVEALQRLGAKIKIYDPEAMRNAAKYFDDEVMYSNDMYDCADDADAVVIVTHWDDFRNIELTRLKRAMKGNGLVDLRNILDGEAASTNGFRFNNLNGGENRERKYKAAVKPDGTNASDNLSTVSL